MSQTPDAIARDVQGDLDARWRPDREAARWPTEGQPLRPVPDTWVSTRTALHHLAEHVVAAKRHAANGRIGLRPVPGGFGTPFFGDDEQVLVIGTTLVRVQAGAATATAITTPRAAADFLEGPCGAPTDVFTPDTGDVRPDEKLSIDRDAANQLAQWYEFAGEVLQTFRDRVRAEFGDDADASPVQLWPEHFDPAFEALTDASKRRTGFGGSPGDGAIPEPYLYVGPWYFAADEDAGWAGAPESDFWNGDSFNGATLTLSDLLEQAGNDRAAQVEAAIAFLRQGLELMCSVPAADA